MPFNNALPQQYPQIHAHPTTQPPKILILTIYLPHYHPPIMIRASDQVPLSQYRSHHVLLPAPIARPLGTFIFLGLRNTLRRQP